jgi:CBS domain-containing protein
MQIREIITQGAEVVYIDDTAQEVAAKMRELDVGALPVCGGDGIQGVVTGAILNYINTKNKMCISLIE